MESTSERVPIPLKRQEAVRFKRPEPIVVETPYVRAFVISFFIILAIYYFMVVFVSILNLSFLNNIYAENAKKDENITRFWQYSKLADRNLSEEKIKEMCVLQIDLENERNNEQDAFSILTSLIFGVVFTGLGYYSFKKYKKNKAKGVYGDPVVPVQP